MKRSGGVIPHTLNLGTEWRWVMSFAYSLVKSLQYSLSKMLGGPHSRSGRFGEEKDRFPSPYSLVTWCLGFMFSFRLQAWFICVTIISRFYLWLDVRLISRSVWLEHIWCEDSGTDRRWLCAKCARNTTYTSLYPGSIILRQNGKDRLDATTFSLKLHTRD